MQILTPGAWPRAEGEFEVRFNNHNPDRPFSTIYLAEDQLTSLVMQSVGECQRLRRAIDTAERLLAEAQTDHAIAADVDAQIRRDGEALGRRIAADEGLDDDEPPSRVPWPTGL